MCTIRTTATVTADHQLVIHGMAPAELAPGQHSAVITIAEAGGAAGRGPLFRPAYPIGLVDPATSFGRDELYDDVDG